MSTEASRVAFLGPKDQLQSYRAAALPAGVAVIPALLDAPEQYEESFCHGTAPTSGCVAGRRQPGLLHAVAANDEVRGRQQFAGNLSLSRSGRGQWPYCLEATLKGAFAKPQGCGRAVCRRQSGRRAARAQRAALELARYNITVNAIAPGPFVTNISGGRLRDPAVRAPFEKFSPMRRLCEPDDIKGLALFLASPAATEATGYVDASGDAALVWQAGFACRQPANGPVFGTQMVILRTSDKSKQPTREEIGARMKEKGDEYGLVRREGLAFIIPGRGVAAMNMTHVETPLDPLEASARTLDGRDQADRAVAFLRREFPGCFGKSRVRAYGLPGIRQTRWIVGRQQLTVDDVRAARVSPTRSRVPPGRSNCTIMVPGTTGTPFPKTTFITCR